MPRTFEKFVLVFICFWCTAFISGCHSGPNYVPVASRPQPPGIKIDYHIVRSGETLYSIAWLYNMDFRELASTNSIAAPYLINPKQKLSLRLQPKEKIALQKQLAIAPKKREVSIKKVISVPKAPKSRVAQTKMGNPGNWHWPTTGPIIREFSLDRNVNKGIDLGGKLGEAVSSAGDGTVVYAGNGILGYGNLIIVKHNQEFLSAYAHNSRILVEEGTNVKVGQVIAEIGSSGTDRNKLHFEVRREGKPVNPLYYLPRR